MTDVHHQDFDDMAAPHDAHASPGTLESFKQLGWKAKVSIGVVAVLALFIICSLLSSLLTSTTAAVPSAKASVTDRSDALSSTIVNSVKPTTNELADRLNGAFGSLNARVKMLEENKMVIDYDLVGKKAAEELKKSLPAMVPVSELAAAKKVAAAAESKADSALAQVAAYVAKQTSQSASAQEAPRVRAPQQAPQTAPSASDEEIVDETPEPQAPAQVSNAKGTTKWGSGKDLFKVAGTPQGYAFDGVSDPNKAKLCVAPRRLVKTDECRKVSTGQIECKNACVD